MAFLKDHPASKTTALYHSDWLIMRVLLADIAGAIQRYARGVLLDVGCGSRPYYQASIPYVERYIGLDHDPAQNPDVLSSALELPFASASMDTVLATQVLEHVPSPWGLIAEIDRVLKPDGTLILSAPQTWRIHDAPHDYYRFTHYGLEYMLGAQGLIPLEIKPQGNVWAVIGQTVNNYLNSSPQVSVRLALRPLVIMNNLCFAALGHVMPGYSGYEETLNYLVVARKKP